jgi:hypothetical protein
MTESLCSVLILPASMTALGLVQRRSIRGWSQAPKGREIEKMV